MKLQNGTPKNISETLGRMMVQPMSKFKELGYHILRDYLSQKFQASFLKAQNEQEVELLRNLWLNIIKEGSDEKSSGV